MRWPAALASAAVVAVAVLPLAAAAQAPPKSYKETPSSSPAPAPPAAGRKQAGKDDRTQPVTVDADKMERFGKEGLVVFTGNVVARQNNSVQYADRMEVYLDERGDRILRSVSTGAVRIITRDCRTGTAKRAEFHELEQRVVLIGNARIWQDDNVVSGETITIFLSQDRMVVQGGRQERVKSILYPKDDKKDGQTATARGPSSSCEN